MRVGIPYTGCKYESEVPCTREDEAIAFACGVILGGGECEVFMQNSGLGHCVDIITSLVRTYGIDVPLEINIRHEPEHHRLMGEITEPLLKLLGYEKSDRRYNVRNNR